MSGPRNLYQAVTDRIIAALAVGVASQEPNRTTARPGCPKTRYPDRPGAGVTVLIRWLTETRCGVRCGAPAGRTRVDGSRDSNGAIGVVRIAPARSGSTEDTARPPWPFIAAARHAAGGVGRAS